MQNKSIPDYGKKKKKIFIAAIAVALLCSLAAGMLVAKYLDERNSDGLLRAQNFYFTSNLLDGKEHTIAPGSDNVTFTVGNHEDDLRYAEMDIEYTVTVDNGATVTGGTGTLAKDVIDDAEITVSGLAAGKKYTITAVGLGGYTKTLTATIVVPEKAAELYYHIDDSAGDYTLLTVWNEGDLAGNAIITYTGIPDNTYPNMTGWKTNKENHRVTIEAHESKVFRFFSGTITVTDATAKELN